MKEQWCDIKGFEKFYEISSYGRVRRKNCTRKIKKGTRNLKESILKPSDNGKGYLKIMLTDEETKKRHSFFIHHLVIIHFVGEKTGDKTQVNHIDGEKKNNHVSNLEWVSPKENVNHFFQNTNKKITRKHLSEDEKAYIRKYYKPRDKEFGLNQMCEKFGVARDTISKIARDRGKNEL